MQNRSFLHIFFTLLFGALLLGARVGACPTDTRDLSNPADVLEARDSIGSTVNSLEVRAKKFRKAKAGSCKKKRSEEQLVKRQTLAELFEAIPASRKAGVGATKYWTLSPTTAADFTTSEFYGCTVVIAVDGQGVVIGHYNEVGSGACIAMENAKEVKDKIIPKLQESVDMVPFSEKATVYIIHTSAANSVGEVQIKKLFTDEGLPADRIRSYRYNGSSGTGEFPGQPKGKAAVKWTPNTTGAQLEIFIERDAARYTAQFDHEGNLCSEEAA